jgi:hypothetical protein
MPDKVSPSQFAKSVKEKYPEYESYDDVKLSQAIIEKYPEYKDIVDFGIKEPSQASIQPIQPVPTSKYQKAVDDDRSRVGKLAATIYNGLVGAAESMGGFVGEVMGTLATKIPSPQYDIGGNKLGPTIYDLSPEQQQKAKKVLKTGIKEGIGKLRSDYVTREEEKNIQGKLDVTNGIGLDDFEGLAAMSGRIIGDIGLAAATGGSSYFMQAYSDGVDDYDEAVAKMGVEPNPYARALYGTATGTINGLLEKYAIDKLVGSGPVFKSIQKKAVANVLKNTAPMGGKVAIDAIEKFAKEEIKDLTKNLKAKGLTAGYRALVEGGTEGTQAALEDGAKLATNWAQGVDAFNEQEVKEQFFKNVLNSAAAGVAFGPVIGFGASKMFGEKINTQVLDDIANAKTQEDLDRINQELQVAFDKNNFNEAERQLVMDNARKYAEVKQTLPAETSPAAQMIAIPKIEDRIKLDNEIKAKQAELSSIDESLKPSYEQDISLLQDKRASLNDEIREVITGENFDYTEENGKFYKVLPDGNKEEISRNRYDLEQLKIEDNATTKGQGPIQKSGTEGDISQYQGAQGEQEQASAKTDSRYRNIVSEEAVGIPSFLGMTVTYKLPNRKITGTLIQEGQTISVEDENGDVVAEIGNIDELSKMSPEQMNLTVIEPNVEITEKGFAVDGKELLNENENPFDAVSIDKNGNVMNVVLTTSAGKRRKFRGRVAQKLATQISQKEDQRLKAEDEQLQKKFAVTPPKAPVVITTQPTIAKVTEENIGEINNIQATPLQKKVFNDVKNVVKAVGAAVKNITGSSVSVNIHDTKSYTDAVIEAGGTQEDAASRGFYMADDGSMHLNYDTLASDTMLHEGFHPILDILEKYNPQVINDLFTQLEGIPEAADIIAQAKEKYDGDITQKKEAITDFVAGVADGRIVLNPSNFQKIKKFILDMLNKIGIGGGGSELMNVNSEQDLVKLAKFVTEKFTTGEQITLESLDLIVGKKQYDSGDGIDIDEVIPEEGSGRGPQFSKETIEAAKKNLKSPSSLKGTKISRVVFYDLTRVGKLDIKNIKTGYTPNVEGKGGPLYSYMPSSIKDKAVLAFTSINQAIQSLQRQILYPNGTHAIAAQNPQTSHLGNKSTLSALFGDGIGIFQEAAKSKAQENEIVKVLVNEIDRISKMPQGEASKSVKKILKTVDLKSIKTLNDFRDNILLGAGNSFGSRGSIFAEILQNKQTKITASTRESHKILHYKYGIPTIADIAQGNNQKELSSAELGDVMKLVRPSTEPVIYTTSKEQFDKYSNNPTPEMKKSGIRIELLPEDSAHESYPFVLAGENVALLDNFISAAQLFDKFSNLPKSKSFFSVGRMKKFAEAGEIPQSVMEEQGGPQFQKTPTKTEKSTKKRFFKDQFLVGGLLGTEILNLKEQMAGELSDEMTKAQKTSMKSMDLIKKYASVVTQQDVEDFLTGKPNANRQIPMDLAATLSEMRAHVDNLTDRLINLGVIDDPEEIAKYQANKGKYLLRSYEIFNAQPTAMEKMLLGKSKTRIDIDNVVKKLKNVDQAKVDRALKFLEKEIAKSDPALSPEQVKEKAIAEANKILADTDSKFAPKKFIGSTNVKSLEERIDIAPEIRALMGEYTDPIYNYYASIFKLAALTSNRKFLNDLRQEGMGKFLFNEATKDATVQVSSEKSEALKPLAGLYTFPEIKEALEEQEKMQTNIAYKFLGWTRKLKTVYNPATHVKNIIGNTGFFISNGHWNYLDEAWRLAKNNPKEFQELMSVLRRQGVLNSSVGIGELRSYFDKHASIDEFLETTFKKAEAKSLKGKTKEQIEKIKRGGLKVAKSIEDAYQMEDDIFKIIAFVNESNRYAKAMFKESYANLTPQQKQEVDLKSSKIVKNTYPTFSRAPKFVKSISKNLLLGNFLTFPVESVRVSYNTLKLAKEEINSGNPDLRRVGMSRLIGTLAYNGLFSTLSYYMSMSAVGIGGMLGAMFDDEDEKEKREKIDLLRAPWTNNSEIIPIKFSDGKLIYVDIGSLDSYSYQKKVWSAFWGNLDDEEGFKKAAFAATKQLIDPYLTLDFTLQTFKDLYDNNDESTGRKIYNPESEGYQDKVIDVSAFLAKKLGPGVIGSAMKMYRFYNEGDAEKLNSEIQSQIVRTYNTDVEKQFARYLYASRAEGNDMTDVGFKERLDDAKSLYTSVKNQKGASQQEIDAAYASAIKAYKNVLSDVSQYYQAALYSGVPQENLIKILYRAKLGYKKGPAEIYSIMKGVADLPDEVYIIK